MNGLKNKFDEIFANLRAMREGTFVDSNGHKTGYPRNVSLDRFIRMNYSVDGSPLTAGHLEAELSIEGGYTSAQDLFAQSRGELVAEYIREGVRRGMGTAQREFLADLRKALQSFAITGEHGGGERWISPEVIMDPVMRGAIQSAFYPDLTIREVMVKNSSVTFPKIELSDAVMGESGEAVTAEVGTITFGKKQVEITKQKKGIEITDEAILFNSIDLLSVFMEDLGAMLAADLNNDAVTVINNGDQDDLSEAAAVIGVDVIGEHGYKDVVRAFVRMSLMNRRPNAIITNEETGIDYLNMPEVKNRNQLGTQLLATTLKTPLPTDQDLYISASEPTDQITEVDTSKTLLQLTARSLMVESDRDIKKGLNGSYAQVWTGFANVQRNSRVVIDRSIAFDPSVGNVGGWPAWMKAYGQA